MTQHILSHLTAAGILERAGGRGNAYLRVTPRFLSHAEGTAGRLRLRTGHDDEHAALETALATWDHHVHNPYQGALFLRDLLLERGQLGRVRSFFPAIEAFAAAGAS
jgi:hypothetical protein